MLLGMMRKHAKSWLIKFLIGIIAVVFIFYFGFSFTAEKGLKVAYVNGELISGMEHEKVYYELLESLQKKYKGMWNDNLIKLFDLKNRALQSLIDQKLISQEAKKLGLDITEDEVQKAIMNYPAFQINGRFVMGRYRSLLSQNRMKPEDFEASMGLELLQGKLRQLLLVFMQVTDQEVRDHYTFTNEKIKISFVQFKPDDFEKSINLDQAAMESFFKEHKETYRVPEKARFAYVVMKSRDFIDQVKITDPEVSDYYEYHIDTFSQPHQVKARHILFRLNQNATAAEEETARQKAESVLGEAKQGKDFAALATKYSEGPTKDRGGDLGYFSKGQMAKPFEDAAFKLKQGEISDLVRTRFGYHIIKAEEIKKTKTKTLDEVRDQIVDTIAKSAATELAYEKGLSLIDQMPYDADLAQYAKQHGFDVEHTGLVSRSEPIPGFGGDEKLKQSLFSLEKGQTSELIELKDIFYIFQVVEKNASYLPEMPDVAVRIKEDFISDLAAREAKAAAESYLAELKTGKTWDELAREKSLKPEETDFFSRRGPIPTIGHAQDLLETAFGLNTGKRYPEQISENDKGAFVIRWEAKKGIDEIEFQKEKEKYRFALIEAKHNIAFKNWLENLRKNADIEIVTPVT